MNTTNAPLYHCTACFQVKIVRVYGHSNDDGQQRCCSGANPNVWYRKVVQLYRGRVGEQSEDGVWQKVQEPDGNGAYQQVHLVHDDARCHARCRARMPYTITHPLHTPYTCIHRTPACTLLQVVLGIMLARPAENESHRLETCTTLHGEPFHQVTRDTVGCSL